MGEGRGLQSREVFPQSQVGEKRKKIAAARSRSFESKRGWSTLGQNTTKKPEDWWGGKKGGRIMGREKRGSGKKASMT